MPMTAVATQYSAKLRSHSASDGERAAADVDERAGHEAAAAADPRHPQRHRHRRQRRAQHVGRRAQRGERLRVDQRIADEAVHRDEPGGVGQQQRLAAGEQEDVAVGSGHRGDAYSVRPGLRGTYHRAWTHLPSRSSTSGSAPRRSPSTASARDVWFRKDPAFDDAIRAALRRRGRRWRSPAASANGARRRSGALARVLLLDQFTRNIFRDTPRAFAGDARALATAEDAVARGFDRELEPVRPLVPATCRSSTRRTSPRNDARSSCSARWRARWATTSPLEWAQKHADVIFRFGRYPHRNAILGRASTPEEEAFLAQPGSRF